MNVNFAIPDIDWNDLGKSITRVCFKKFRNKNKFSDKT